MMLNLKIIQKHIYSKKKKISTALDITQRNSCTIGESVEVWLRLKTFFESEYDENDFQKLKKKY